MWYTWLVVLLVSSVLVRAEVAVAADAVVAETVGVATTRAPPRTLDRKADELAWRSWLQGPENGNQNATHRRITTKSLFITPLVCPKGQRLDRNGCVQIVTVNKDEHERILLDQLNALFTSAPNNGDVMYDYGDEEQGPLQLSIPIGLDPQAAPQEMSAQAQNSQPTYVQFDKKGESISNTDAASIQAELELLKLQQATTRHNNTDSHEANHKLSQNLLTNLLTYADKPKRDSPPINNTQADTIIDSDKGQEEIFFGQVNVDPLTYDIQNQDEKHVNNENKKNNDTSVVSKNKESPLLNILINKNTSNIQNTTVVVETIPNTTMQSLKVAPEQIKLSPENEYSDIGEAIKLISRYADVSTDDNFAKDLDKKPESIDEYSVLGTRTKLQYRRNKPKLSESLKEFVDSSAELVPKNKVVDTILTDADSFRYPWPEASPTPNYPFRHLQDYWPGQNRVGGVYNSLHENPRRHHHSFHYFRPRTSYPGYTESQSILQQPYPRLRRYPHKVEEGNYDLRRPNINNQDLYSLLGFRHWFGSEGASKR